MAENPTWKSSFPVRQSLEHDVSRRQFCKFACCSTLAVTAGWFAKDRFISAPSGTKPMLVAGPAELAVGGYKLFTFPDESHPCILVRLSEAKYAAYSQSCTHLMCPVNYQAASRQFYCPCHEGYFSAEDGRVLSGPPPRPLPRYSIEIRDGKVWVLPRTA